MLSDWEREVRRVLDEMPVRARAELLRALRLSPRDMDEEIGRREADSRTRRWAELLVELREEPAARLTDREMLEQELK